MEIYLDIETIPDQRPGALDAYLKESRENFKAPSTLTKEQAAKDLGMKDASEIKFTSKDAMVALWCDRFRDERSDEVGETEWRKTSFDGARGQIVCIGFACDGAAPFSYSTEECGDEKEVLASFFSYLTDVRSIEDRPVFIGHNHIAFDLPFIWKRAIILGVKPPIWFPRNPRAWDDHVFDTMLEWAGFGNRISMDALCNALGIPGKPDGIDGSQVWDYVRDGKIADVAEYCKGDVERTREIYRRLTFAEAA